MKLLLIYTKEEEDAASRIESLLLRLDIPFETFPLKSSEDRDIHKFAAFFDSSGSEKNDQERENTPTHVLIISSLFSEWFDFLAGFACGSRLPLLIYGQEAIPGISKEFAAFFTFLVTEASLQTYLEAENEASKKQKAARSIIKAQEILLNMGIPVTVESLAQCVAEDRAREISFFLAAGFSANSRNKAGVPLLNIAARNGKRDLVGYLITAGADVNLRAEDRSTTALMDSVLAGHRDIADDLIKAGTDLNMKDKNGQTALVVAAGAGDEKTVEILFKAGADPDISDMLGVSARKYATLFKNEAMLAIFSTPPPPASTAPATQA
jgi:hypothetical protein